MTPFRLRPAGTSSGQGHSSSLRCGRARSIALRRWGWRLARGSLWALTAGNALLLAALLLALVVPLPDRTTVPSVVVEYRDGRPAFVFLSPDDKWRLAVEVDRNDPKLVDAMVALEDQRFLRHDGVDAVAIARAAISNAAAGRVVSGA
jgi:penicillin-binding protein 1C